MALMAAWRSLAHHGGRHKRRGISEKYQIA